MNDNNSRFKLTSNRVNTFVFTTDGIEKDDYTFRKDNVIVAMELEEVPSDFKTVYEDHARALKEGGVENVKIRNASSETLNELTISESEIIGTLSEDSILLYLAFATNGNKTVFLQGGVHADFDTSVSDFKKLSRSITFKD